MRSSDAGLAGDLGGAPDRNGRIRAWTARLRTHLRRAAGRDRNPLLRRCDRLRSGLVLAGLAVAVVAVGLCWLPGLLVAQMEHGQAAYASAHHHRVQAVALADSVPADNPQPFAGASGYDTAMGWSYPAGHTHRLLVATPNSVRAGAVVPLWVNDQGRQVSAPRSGGQISIDAVWAGTTTLMAEALIALGVVTAVRHGLQRSAQRAWEQEWERVEPRWTGRAGGRSPA